MISKPSQFIVFFFCYVAVIVANNKALCEDNFSFPKQHILIESGSIKADISQSYKDLGPDIMRKAGTLNIEINNANDRKKWELPYELNAESWLPNSQPVMLLQTEGGNFLFVHGYSGGASCCWTLLVFNLDELSYSGNTAASTSPIEFDDSMKNICKTEIGAWITPDGVTQRAQLKSIYYCFDNGKFVATNRKR